MRLFFPWTAAASAAVLIALSGCASPKEDVDQSGPPPPPKFAGKVDSDLVGNWKTADGQSELDLHKDGTLQIDTATPGPQGTVKGQKTGAWLVDGGRLVLKYKLDSGSDQVVSYGLQHSGTSMTLSTKVPKRETKYVRR